ncbi:hypothetical protein AVEN_259847-1 [Araneus ventricosus]|uniref:Uncharacterized protein n=1 Tax=Araneus ventricosus TaxID=182803 RepID=A0A4Y2U2M9_ARAVE|nr:hypothetical protein AVEN_136491-1 [Araneus ventricosus]GBO06311.1 hypothetical protein AVEN_184117-1 [Araneus ventricosus]GBO06344.1 hypothetical protein AVEN_254917-1 [Araneus ventricosus]GBO06345.1 hypothetical protein AVEN_259847-1 [Araneus ventricosus]
MITTTGVCCRIVWHSTPFQFLVHSFRLVVHDRSTPLKSTHSDPLSPPLLVPSSSSRPAAFMARQSKWSDGFRDRLDIQPSAPHRSNSHQFFPIDDRLRSGVVTNVQPYKWRNRNPPNDSENYRE